MSTISTQPEEMGFGRLRIAFDGRVLRPRTWTAAQSAWAAEILADAHRRDPCSSSARAPVRSACSPSSAPTAGWCASTSTRSACDCARRNADAAGLADRVEVREGPIDEVVRDDERFAVVIADPPWVRRDRGRPLPRGPARSPSTAARTAWTSPGPASTSPVGTCSRADRCCSSSGPSSRSTRSRALPPTTSSVTEVRWHERGVLVRIDLS